MNVRQRGENFIFSLFLFFFGSLKYDFARPDTYDTVSTIVCSMLKSECFYTFYFLWAIAFGWWWWIWIKIIAQ